jgi:hypothetical protein
MSNSSNLITRQDMVRNLSIARDSFLIGAMSYDAYVGILLSLLAKIEEARRELTYQSSTWVPDGELCEELDNQEAYVSSRLTATRRHRNSTCFQGGDFDLYLSCQDPGNVSSRESGWGVL